MYCKYALLVDIFFILKHVALMVTFLLLLYNCKDKTLRFYYKNNVHTFVLTCLAGIKPLRRSERSRL